MLLISYDDDNGFLWWCWSRTTLMITMSLYDDDCLWFPMLPYDNDDAHFFWWWFPTMTSYVDGDDLLWCFLSHFLWWWWWFPMMVMISYDKGCLRWLMMSYDDRFLWLPLIIMISYDAAAFLLWWVPMIIMLIPYVDHDWLISYAEYDVLWIWFPMTMVSSYVGDDDDFLWW